MPNPQNIVNHKFKKGGDPRRWTKGRPRKLISELKELGYTRSEVNDCIQLLMSMTIDELKSIFENPKATVLEKTIASAINKSIQRGSLYSIETLLTRVYGQPKQEIDASVIINKFDVKFNQEQQKEPDDRDNLSKK